MFVFQYNPFELEVFIKVVGTSLDILISPALFFLIIIIEGVPRIRPLVTFDVMSNSLCVSQENTRRI